MSTDLTEEGLQLLLHGKVDATTPRTRGGAVPTQLRLSADCVYLDLTTPKFKLPLPSGLKAPPFNMSRRVCLTRACLHEVSSHRLELHIVKDAPAGRLWFAPRAVKPKRELIEFADSSELIRIASALRVCGAQTVQPQHQQLTTSEVAPAPTAAPAPQPATRVRDTVTKPDSPEKPTQAELAYVESGVQQFTTSVAGMPEDAVPVVGEDQEVGIEVTGSSGVPLEAQSFDRSLDRSTTLASHSCVSVEVEEERFDRMLAPMRVAFRPTGTHLEPMLTCAVSAKLDHEVEPDWYHLDWFEYSLALWDARALEQALEDSRREVVAGSLSLLGRCSSAVVGNLRRATARCVAVAVKVKPDCV